MNLPPSVLKDLLAESIAISSGLGSMVGNPVAFDAANEPAFDRIIENGQIDAIATGSHLRNHSNPASGELNEHLPLERRFRFSRGFRCQTVEPPVFGES